MPTTIPDWAQRHLQTHLPPGTPIVNATTVGGRRVLANTRLGAVLVRRSFFGGVEHVLLEVPRGRQFPCGKCHSLVGIPSGRGAHNLVCDGCGAKYHVAPGGKVTDAMGVEVRLSGAATAPGRAGSEGSAKVTWDIGSSRRGTGAYTHGGYTLYARTTSTGGSQYFFAKATPKAGSPSPLPDGYEVGTNSRSGLPFLRRSGGSTTATTGGRAGPGRAGTGRAAAKPTPTARSGAGDGLHAQCAALTAGGAQCRNSARGTSRYCASHKGYQPPGARAVADLLDTEPARGGDRLLAVRGRATALIPGEQCLAITAVGAQCRNTARTGSKYCPSHRSYQPPASMTIAARRDTKPRVKGAPDTLPAVRRLRR